MPCPATPPASSCAVNWAAERLGAGTRPTPWPNHVVRDDDELVQAIREPIDHVLDSTDQVLDAPASQSQKNYAAMRQARLEDQVSKVAVVVMRIRLVSTAVARTAVSGSALGKSTPTAKTS